MSRWPRRAPRLRVCTLALALCSGLSAALPAAPAAPTATPQARGAVLRAFDEADYRLAYDALIAAGRLEPAQALAQAAVLARPRDPAWRQRLIQVATWRSDVTVLSQQWLELFALGDRSPQVLREVARLAPLQNQPLQAIAARQALLALSPPSRADWLDLARLYEQAAEPRQGSLWFEAQFARSRWPLLLELAAQLAERGGDDARAIALYEQRAAQPPFMLAAVTAAASLRLRGGDEAGALRTLRSALPQVQALASSAEPAPGAAQDAAQSAVYWRLLAELAWDLQDSATAQVAYTQVGPRSDSGYADWSRWISLSAQTQPREAALLAQQAWQRLGESDFFLLALELFDRVGDNAGAERALTQLSPAQAERLASVPRYWLLRAQWHSRQQRPDAAWADTQRARALSPLDPELAQAALWMAIDQNRVRALPALLAELTPRAGQNPALAAALAAGHLHLHQTRLALPWQQRQLRAQPGDALAWLAYADSLQSLGHAGQAGRVRVHAWALLRAVAARAPDAPQAPDAQLWALYRLALSEPGSERARRVALHLAGRLRHLPTQADDAMARELVLGWLIQADQPLAARAWMWQRYLRETAQAAPLWAQAQVALQLQDSPSLAHLLQANESASAWPSASRFDAQLSLGRVDAALHQARARLAQGDDPELQERLRLHAPQRMAYVQTQISAAHSSDAHGTQAQLEARLWLRSSLSLTVQANQMPTQIDTPALRGSAPPRQPWRASLDASEGPWHWQAQWLQRDGTAGLAVQAQRSLQAGVQLDAALSWRMDTTLNTALALDGRMSAAQLGLSGAWDRRWGWRVSAQASQLQTQDGIALGAGRGLDLELNYALRRDAPAWRLRAWASWRRYSPATAPAGLALADPQLSAEQALALYLPADSSLWGVCAGLGDNLGGQSLFTYSRAWGPYGEVCVDNADRAVSGTLGWAGAIDGLDQLRVEWIRTGAGANTSSGQSWLARYRRYF